MKYSKTIYKKDTKGNVRYLSVQVLGLPEGELIQTSGIINTDNPIVHSKICKSKNVGKKNETTANQQAILEAEALIKKKLNKDYFFTEEDALESNVITPMLAYDYKLHSHKINWNKDEVYVQPKFDGMRMTKDTNILKSRENNKILTMNHIASELNNIKDILDGELYVHGEDFQTNMEYIKKYRKGLSEKIKYHVYDMIYPNLDFKQRYNLLKNIIDSCKPKNIVLAPTYRIHSEEELAEYHVKFIEQGYEGTMVRISKSGYKVNGRSSELLKYKDFQDLALTILDIVPCKVMTDWGEPIFSWPGATGHRLGKDILGAGTKLSHEKKRELLANKENYIGKTAELRFFEYSNNGVPRFPIYHGIRLDK